MLRVKHKKKDNIKPTNRKTLQQPKEVYISINLVVMSIVIK